VRGAVLTKQRQPLFPIEQALADASQSVQAARFRSFATTQFFLLPFIFRARELPAKRPLRLVVNLYGSPQENEIEKSRKVLETFAPQKLNKAVFQFALFHRSGLQACGCTNRQQQRIPAHTTRETGELEQRR
jgi:hypothetical protein